MVLQEIQEAYRRIRLLQDYYRRLARTQHADGTWDWWIDREIEQLQAGIKRLYAGECQRKEVS